VAPVVQLPPTDLQWIAEQGGQALSVDLTQGPLDRCHHLSQLTAGDQAVAAVALQQLVGSGCNPQPVDLAIPTTVLPPLPGVLVDQAGHLVKVDPMPDRLRVDLGPVLSPRHRHA
jgi:hypothetical protein